MLGWRRYLINGILMLLFLICLTILFTSRVLAYKDQGMVPPGVSVCGVEIGEVSEEEAVCRLKTSLPDRGGRHLEFVIQEENIRLPCEKYGIVYDYEGIVRHAIYGNQEGLKAITYHAWMRGGKLELAPILVWNADVLPEILWDVKQQVNRPSQDARVVFKDDTLEYIPQQNGYTVEERDTLANLREALDRGQLKGIKIEVRTEPPRVKMEDIKTVKDLLGVHVTSFNPQEKNRTANLEKARETVDETLVWPGEVFSLDKCLGPRLKEAGYYTAPILAGSKGVAYGVGGGICQVATTLYNAVIQTDLKVIERKAHSQPIEYAPPGLDATIAGNYYDLKFQNTSQHPVLISMQIKNNRLYARIFGQQLYPQKEIRLVTETVKMPPKKIIKQDPTLPEGVQMTTIKGRDGYRVKTYRVELQEGKELEKKLLSQDYYPGRDTVIVIGSNSEPGIAK